MAVLVKHCTPYSVVLLLLVLVLNATTHCHGKYVEGRLKTLEEFSFLSRFCFLSGRGRFEYLIEFERRFGEPQLLLYYDDVTQWPSVYKTKKNCPQKLAVLSNSDRQIVTLSARPPHNYYSGCTLETRYPDSKPSLPISTPFPPHGGIGGADEVTSYYDHFLTTGSAHDTADDVNNATTTSSDGLINNRTSPEDGRDALLPFDSDWPNAENFPYNFTGYNDTEVFNASAGGGARHGGSLENDLEQDADYSDDVERMFEDGADGASTTVRMRRSLATPMHVKHDNLGTVLVTCNNIGGFTSSRERWWYIAIANCGSRKGLDLKYKFRLTNGPPGDFWHEHFSADEMYILPIYLVEALLYSLLLVAVFICSIELRTLHLLHCTYRLFGFSVVMQWIGVLLHGIAYSMYGMTGLPPRTLLASLFVGASEVCFLILMLLLAKGYTITRARLSSMSAIKLTIFVNVYIVVYVSLFIFQAETFDPGDVLNLYESPAGVALGALRVGAWGAFVISTVNTYKKNPEKGSFYVPFGLLGSLWIMGGPLTTVFGVAVLDPWVRESVICFVLASIAFGGHAAFLYLTWPSRANKSFPYHVRTNHVGIASTVDDGADYPRHTYEPALADQNTIIPLSRRTEELLTNAYGSYLIERLDAANNVRAVPPHLSPRRDYPRAGGDLFKANTTSATSTSASHDSGLAMERTAAAEAADHARRPNDSTRNEDDEDSGHPSLETSTSISPNDSAPPSAEDSPMAAQRSGQLAIPAAGSMIFNGTSRPNPFVVNGVQRAPNKIILEPIERPLAEQQQQQQMRTTPVSSAGSVGSVPRHLFAAKNP